MKERGGAERSWNSLFSGVPTSRCEQVARTVREPRPGWHHGVAVEGEKERERALAGLKQSMLPLFLFLHVSYCLKNEGASHVRAEGLICAGRRCNEIVSTHTVGGNLSVLKGNTAYSTCTERVNEGREKESEH